MELTLLTALKTAAIAIGVPVAFYALVGALALLVVKLSPRPPRLQAGEASDFKRIHSRMRRMARPTLLLTPTHAPRFSKLGGEPEAPHGWSWPLSAQVPLAFLAQLDLAEVRAAGGPEWLPEAGALYIFNDDQRFGCADHVRVLFSPDGERTPMAAPVELPKRHRFGERRVGFLPMTSIPSLEWLGLDIREVQATDEELDMLTSAADEAFSDQLQHRIGGYPSEIQEAWMAIECEHLARGLKYDPAVEPSETIRRASKTWRLLLQVDSDPALGMKWGDGGRLYVFIRERHARASDFSKTVSLAHTY